MRNRSNRINASGHLVIGALLIIVGGLFLLDTLGIADASNVISKGWPFLLIGIGVARIIGASDVPSRTNGGIWIFLGVVFALVRFGYLHFDVWRLIWPLALIALGVMVVIRSRWGFNVPEETASRFNSMAILGGVDRKITSKEFEGAELTSIMGGCKIDLREAAMSGPESTIEVFVVMGGIELLVPQGWAVIAKVMPVMGGFEDKTNPNKDYSKRLVVRGTVLMGGCEVRNF